MPLISPSTFAELREMSGEDLINELIDAFLDDAPRMIAAMQAGLEAGDVESVRRNAHSMKSNAETFGATELAVVARELEALARAGDLEVGNRFEVLQESYRGASQELQGLRV
jgi:HPt (histidine-containing phosphotransfer) domain-containing protein